MILETDIFQKYKEYLNILDYPFIKQLTDYEIIKLFDKENRILFLSWLIIKLLPSYNNKIEEAKENNRIEDLLTIIIYENGLCRIFEKEEFVKDTLDDNKQILIFNKIFSMLSLLHSRKKSSNETVSQEQQKLKQLFIKHPEELRNNLTYEDPLIPTIRLINKMSVNERKNKMISYLEEIDNIKNILEQEEKEIKSLPTENVSTFFEKDTMENSINKLKNIMEKFTTDKYINSIVKENKSTSTILYNTEEIEKQVETDSKEITDLLNNWQKRKDLQKFLSEENNGIKYEDSIVEENDFSYSIHENYLRSNNIFEEEIYND